MRFGEKAVAVLRIAALPIASPERKAAYEAACANYSEKSVLRTFERLAHRHYVEYGVSPRTSWLTDKGRFVLECQ
jgi:hypothetical protein